MTYLDELIERGNDPIGAAAEMTIGLMRGDPTTMKLGYSIGSALIAATEGMGIKAGDAVAVVAERVVDTIEVHHSATRRPLVVAYMEGGIVQDETILPGLGKPEFVVLDFDREGDDENGIEDFIARYEATMRDLAARGVEPDLYWVRLVANMNASLPGPKIDWPVDHAEGE